MLNRKTSFIAALALVGASVAAGSAQAANVQWSVGINLPPVTTVVSGGPVYGQPVYVEPAYAPAPVYVQPAPVVVYPAPVVYRPYYRPHYHPYPVYAPPHVMYRGGWEPAHDGGRDHGWDRGHWERHDGHR